MSARGRNLLFAHAIFDALQIDNEKIPNRADYKRAFTAEAVRKIHEAVNELWPPDTKLENVLGKSSDSVSGFYIGDYEAEYIERSIVRHCLYADKIILADPFMHPYVVAPKFNPIVEPNQHRSQTLKNVNRFFRFLPWIEAGLVEFTRTPDDLNRELAWSTLQHAEKLKADPEIRKSLDETAEQLMNLHEDKRAKQFFYSAPDAHLRRIFRDKLSDGAPISEDQFIEYVNSQRDADPDFLEPLDGSGGQLQIMTSGGTVEMARITAEMSGSYLFTDLAVRWEILKKERETLAPVSKIWSPFAKAMQEVDLSFLNNLNLSVALRLRSEGRLEGVRRVLREAWESDRSSDEFDEANAIHLAENLRDSVRESEAEWADIKSDLAKFGAAELAAGAMAAGPLITSGHAQWLAGASLATIAGNAVAAYFKRQGFVKRFPASFFMDLTYKE